MTHEGNIVDITFEQSEDMDALFFNQVQMPKEGVLRKLGDLFYETRETAYSTFTTKGIYDSFPIDGIDGERVVLSDGTELKSGMLARVLAKSDTAYLYAVVVHGFEEEFEAAEGDIRRQLFLDSWGTAFAEMASRVMQERAKERIVSMGLYATCGWSPGQHGIDIRMQQPVFKLLDPSRIGLTLNESCLMLPHKSETGIFGAGVQSDIELIRACDFCERVKTCPSAYA